MIRNELEQKHESVLENENEKERRREWKSEREREREDLNE